MSSSLLLNEVCRFKLEPDREKATVIERLFGTYSEIVKACWESLKATHRERIITPFKVHEYSGKFMDWKIKDLMLIWRGSLLHMTFRKIIEGV